MKIKIPNKIPSILGILITAGLVFLVSKGSNSLFDTSTSAIKSVQPQNIAIHNVTDSSFTVHWFTNDAATGTILLESDKSKSQVYHDDRDTSQKQHQYTSHSVSIRELSPATTYNFTILSGGKKYHDATPVYTARTSNEIQGQTNTIGPIYGSVTNTKNQPATDTLVVIWFDASQTLSTVVSDSGSWVIPINQMRTKSMDSYFNPVPDMPVHIKIQNATDTSNVTIAYSNKSQVPLIVLGKSYDFRQKAMAVTLTPTPTNEPVLALERSPAGKVLGDIIPKKPSSSYVVDIVKPANKATIVVARPLFQGYGIPGKQANLVLSGISPSAYTATVAADGTWQFSPEKDIGIGKQSVTLTSPDRTGKTVTVVHMYEILKSGTQVLGDATPSASLTPTTATQITPTVIPTVLPTVTPDEIQATPSPAGPINLEPGISIPTIIFLGIGTVLILSGVVLFQL